MKILKNIKHKKGLKQKFMFFSMAMIVPLSATGAMLAATPMQPKHASAEVSSTQSYVNPGWSTPVSITNGNFSSNSSDTSFATQISGWAGTTDMPNSKYELVTAGTIVTGSRFEDYVASRANLSKDPGAKSSLDNHVLMINSKTSSTQNNSSARFGYRSLNEIQLDANSFYAFQVSFKGDCNYTNLDEYEYLSTTKSAASVKNFQSVPFEKEFETDSSASTQTTKPVYVTATYQNRNYYFKKFLTKTNKTFNSSDYSTSENPQFSFFYKDDNFVGVVLKKTIEEEATFEYFYVSADKTTEVENDSSKVTIENGVDLFDCNITYTPSSSSADKTYGTYETAQNADYYSLHINHKPYSAVANGSVYLAGLKDENGNTIAKADNGDVSCEFENISANTWSTLYFFVATGNTSQSVKLEMWLGSRNVNSTGVMFFDDVKASKYSENAFWQTYFSYKNQTYTDLQTGKTACTKLINLSQNNNLEYANFNFEKGISSNGLSENWTKAENSTGKAAVFNVNDASGFPALDDGFKNVGSDFSATVVVDENGNPIDIKENTYALALWAKDKFVLVNAKNKIDIAANEVYKISAKYKLSEGFSGNAYVFVEEDDGVLQTYGLKESQYTLTAKTASNAINSAASNDFSNNYGTIDFYVKGNTLYNSAVKLSLGLGKQDENATGCIVFDNITVAKATSEEYSSSTSKVQLGSISSDTPTIANGNFNSVTSAQNQLAKPADWTIESEDGTYNFGGVINTAEENFKTYQKLYDQQKQAGVSDAKNTYLWADGLQNPFSSNTNTATANNVMMLANTNASWQKLTSGSIALNGTQKISFSYKTQIRSAGSGIFVTLYGVGENNEKFVLFQSTQPLTSQANWKNFEIYLNSASTTNNVIVEVSFGKPASSNKNDAVLSTGYAFLDNFEISSVSATTFSNKSANAANNQTYAVVDMSDMFSHLSQKVDGSQFLENPLFTSNGPQNGIKSVEQFKDKNSIFHIEEDGPEQVFFLNSINGGTENIKSRLNLDLSATGDEATYYSLTFKLKTNFSSTPDTDENFGVSIGFDQFTYATNLVSNNEYSTYTLYFKVSETTATKLDISLVCPKNISATAVLYFDFSKEAPLKTLVDSTQFDAAQNEAKQADYDVNKNKTFVATPAESTEETPDDNTTSDTTAQAGQNFNWLAIPTIIFGLAIVVAVVGWTLRKVKIKKIEVKRKETYDRDSSLHVDEIKRMAKAEIAAEAEQVESTIAKFQKELDSLEKLHREKVVSSRESDAGKVSKSTDKEFKNFAQKRTVIAERVESLKKQLEEINSPEHQLAVERKIYTKQQAQNRNLRKKSKKK